jgi:predicted negative regulator of RcsB-dependent stress response
MSEPRDLAHFVALAAILLFGAFSLAGWSLYTSHQNSCNARAVTLNIMSDILVDAQKKTDKSRTDTAAQKVASNAFVAYELRRIKKAEC